MGYYQALSCLELARGNTLLDMPCGDGFITEIMRSRFSHVVGVDASSYHLEEARKRLPGIKLHEAYLEEFESNDRFDTITMINVLEHVKDPVFALKHVSRLLSSNGIIIVHVPNALAINRRIAVLMGTLIKCEELSPFDIHVAGHRRSYSLSSLCHEINKAGLKIIQTGGIFYKMLSTPQMDWFLKNGLWETGGFGWGREGCEMRDWKYEFCRACYEIGKERPEDCNIIYACIET